MKKKCSGCKQEKEITEFNKNKAKRDGYRKTYKRSSKKKY